MNSKNKIIYSWAIYDWANSAFATTVMAGFFPLFFKAYWANPNNPAESTFYLGIGNSIASIIIAAMAPFLGAIADKGSFKKKFLILFAFLGIIMTGALSIVQQGFWQMAIMFYILATIGFSSANTFYDSFLPHLDSNDRLDWISSLGYGLGYIGGGILFLVNVIMFLKPTMFGLANEAMAIKVSFFSVAVWWAFFSIPIYLFVPEPKLNNEISFFKSVKLGLTQIKETFYEIKKFKYVMLFLLSYWFYIDGVDTIVKMSVDYGLSIGFEKESLIIALLIVQFVAFPATLLYCKFGSMIGTKRAIYVAIIGYGIITVFGYFMNSQWHFYTLAIFIGFFQGGIQALSRSLYSKIIPKDKTAEFFGFYNMLGKFAAVIGPALMGFITFYTADPRKGILSILILFLIGLILLTKVDTKKAEKLIVKG